MTMSGPTKKIVFEINQNNDISVMCTVGNKFLGAGTVLYDNYCGKNHEDEMSDRDALMTWMEDLVNECCYAAPLCVGDVVMYIGSKFVNTDYRICPDKQQLGEVNKIYNDGTVVVDWWISEGITPRQLKTCVYPVELMKMESKKNDYMQVGTYVRRIDPEGVCPPDGAYGIVEQVFWNGYLVSWQEGYDTYGELHFIGKTCVEPIILRWRSDSCKTPNTKTDNNIKIVKQDSYKVGDKVKIVDKWVSGIQNWQGKMDKWLGKVMTVRVTDAAEQKNIYLMEEDADDPYLGWYWSADDIEGKVIEDTESESKSTEIEPEFHVGDTVEFKNKDRHNRQPIFYPPVGTRGTIVRVKTETIWVQWEKGSTSEDDCWGVVRADVKKITDEPTYKFNVGDLVVGNQKANEAEPVCKMGWVGIVERTTKNSFQATPYGEDGGVSYVLSYDCFDKITVETNE